MFLTLVFCYYEYYIKNFFLIFVSFLVGLIMILGLWVFPEAKGKQNPK